MLILFYIQYMNMQEKKKQFRHELKYYLNMADYLVIRSRLSNIASSDPFAGSDGKYRIRSLYFETPDDKALQEKLTGVNEREKFRIRYYNNDTSFIRLEKKEKTANASSKVNCSITKEEVDRILAGDKEWMINAGRPLLVELYAKMKYLGLQPRTIVDYDRECFIYTPGNVRIALDSNISTGIYAVNLFDDVPMIKAHGVPVIILEVKYDNFLPMIIQELVQLPNRRWTAFSKYASARVFG